MPADLSQRLGEARLGHVVTQGTTEIADETVERLVALNTADGSVAWTLDDIEQFCLPVATDDGRILATLAPNSDTAGVDNGSHDPVEIDAATGQITNRYTASDDDAEPGLAQCSNELRLGAGGILLAYTIEAFEDALFGIDTTTSPMSLGGVEQLLQQRRPDHQRRRRQGLRLHLRRRGAGGL